MPVWCLECSALVGSREYSLEADRLVSAGFGSKSHRGGCHLCHIECAGSNPGRTTRPHVERQRGMVDGGRVVAAACFRRPEQEDSKSNSSRAPGPSRALSQSRSWCLAVRGVRPKAHPSRLSRRADSFQAGHASSILVTRSIALCLVTGLVSPCRRAQRRGNRTRAIRWASSSGATDRSPPAFGAVHIARVRHHV